MSAFRKRNKLVEVSFIGGLIGFVMISPRSTIDARIAEANAHGWSFVAFQKSSGTNLLTTVLRFFLLILTLGMFTFGDGMYLVFEKSASLEDE